MSIAGTPTDLEIDAVFFDAGNTLIFLDHDAVADIVSSHGYPLDGRVLAQKEVIAKRKYESLLAAGHSHEVGWGAYLLSLLESAGLPPQIARGMLLPLRRAHNAFNLWRKVPPGLTEALACLKRGGFLLGVISNSEGRLCDVFERVGLAGFFDTIVDSHWEGVKKPDPSIFLRAATRLKVEAKRCIYLGDIPGVDIHGAQKAGMRAVLVDPLNFYPDHHSSPRVSGVPEFVEAFVVGEKRVRFF
ncbi:MAG: HAD family hydrolase [Sandaracinaceae bacterium]|nr:HAD family hydrolase [Sandaracinaceae bacterium]MDW8247076.1 HAD family hydrolase [Sandaracinaceae bacterium]